MEGNAHLASHKKSNERATNYQQRIRLNQTTMTNTSRPRVSFSPISSVTVIPKAKDRACWYTREEILDFKRALAKDVHHLRRLFSKIDTAAAVDEDVYKSVGIEIQLSPTLLSKVMDMRRAHSAVVLATQDLFQESECLDKPEALSQVSSRSSEWACEQAHQVAVHRAKLMMV